MKKDSKLKLEIMTREHRLIYYNNNLLKNGVKTKCEHDKMNLAIISKYGKRRHDELHEISLEELFFRTAQIILCPFASGSCE